MEKTITLNVVCENTDCLSNGEIINTYEIPVDVEDSFYENWRPDEECLCKICGLEGVLQDPD